MPSSPRRRCAKNKNPLLVEEGMITSKKFPRPRGGMIKLQKNPILPEEGTFDDEVITTGVVITWPLCGAEITRCAAVHQSQTFQSNRPGCEMTNIFVRFAAVFLH